VRALQVRALQGRAAGACTSGADVESIEAATINRGSPKSAPVPQQQLLPLYALQGLTLGPKKQRGRQLLVA
jgi:hypothetical protein